MPDSAPQRVQEVAGLVVTVVQPRKVPLILKAVEVLVLLLVAVAVAVALVVAVVSSEGRVRIFTKHDGPREKR